MDHARIAELLAPFLSDRTKPGGRQGTAGVVVDLSPAQLRHISMYIDILLRWNARINLTAVREPEEIVTRHFGESIFAARHLFPQSGSGCSRSEPALTAPHVIDVGSGAGFPGLPVKIWDPHLRLTLIESSQKKATFLREVARALGLAGVEVFDGRADDFSGGHGDVVTLRAVERFEAILPVAAGLLAPAGRLAILIGESQLKRAWELAPGLRWSDPLSVPLSDRRLLTIGSIEPR